MALPSIATHDEWLAARKRLLAEEKELTRARDRLSSRRRELPMVEVTEDYVFTGPDGPMTLADMFEGRDQLIVGHFMFQPEWEDGCPSCTAGAQEVGTPGVREHLEMRDTTLAYVSLAPIEKIERYKAKMGWTFPWYSSGGTGFNRDFAVTVDPDDPASTYNYRSAKDLPAGEFPGLSCFLKVGDRVFHTYSCYARGGEWFGGSYALLDLTALGRQEDWEEPKGRSGSVRGAVPNFLS